MNNERKLINGILDGSEPSLRRFYDTYSPRLTNFVRQKVSNEKDVEEIVQDTFLATIEAFRDFTFQSSVYTFMCAIAKRKVVDFYRRSKIKGVVFSQMPAIEPFLVLFTTPEDKLDEKIVAEKIEKAFARLSPRYQTILRLKYKEEWPVSEIAKKLSISFKSAESMLFRARKAFVARYETIHINE